MKSISFNISKTFTLLIALSVGFAACDFGFDLPEAGSIADKTLPMASFSTSQTDPDDFRVVTFTNESNSATEYNWDFGGGATSTSKDPSYTFEAGEGTYSVTLSVKDGNGITDQVTNQVTVIEPEEPDAIVPTILNGDFQEGQDDWKFSSFSGGTTSPFNSSSDGAPTNYDGSDNGGKTPGAKWTKGTSAENYASSSTRYAYQALVVSAETEYWLEYEYAIKNDGSDAPGGNRIVGGIIGGHYDDGANAISGGEASAPILVQHVGTIADGKGNFNLVKEKFTTNATGQIAILIYGVTDVDAYADNVKVYPVE